MDGLFEVQAIILREGWKAMLVISADPLPLLKVCKVSPPSELNIFMSVPFCDALAISVPSGLTASAPMS